MVHNFELVIMLTSSLDSTLEWGSWSCMQPYCIEKLWLIISMYSLSYCAVWFTPKCRFWFIFCILFLQLRGSFVCQCVKCEVLYADCKLRINSLQIVLNKVMNFCIFCPAAFVNIIVLYHLSNDFSLYNQFYVNSVVMSLISAKHQSFILFILRRWLYIYSSLLVLVRNLSNPQW